jgi:hypothetical protein
MLRSFGSSPRVPQRTRAVKLAVAQPESSKLWPPPVLRDGLDRCLAGRGAGDGDGEEADVLGALDALRVDDRGVALAAAARAAAARVAAAARALRTARSRRAARSAARSKDSARTRSELPTSFAGSALLTLGVLDSVWTKSPKPKWMTKASMIATRRKTISFDSRRIAPRDGAEVGDSTRRSSGFGRGASGSSRTGCGSTGAGNERSCGLVAKT